VHDHSATESDHVDMGRVEIDPNRDVCIKDSIECTDDFVDWQVAEGVPRVLGFAAKWDDASESYDRTPVTCPAIVAPALERLIGDVSIAAKSIALSLTAHDGARYVAHVLPLRIVAPNGAGVVSNAVAALFVRKVELDGHVKRTALVFRATANWNAWSKLYLGSNLAKGRHTIKIWFDKPSGSANWLNLDNLSVRTG